MSLLNSRIRIGNFMYQGSFPPYFITHDNGETYHNMGVTTEEFVKKLVDNNLDIPDEFNGMIKKSISGYTQFEDSPYFFSGDVEHHSPFFEKYKNIYIRLSCDGKQFFKLLNSKGYEIPDEFKPYLDSPKDDYILVLHSTPELWWYWNGEEHSGSGYSYIRKTNFIEELSITQPEFVKLILNSNGVVPKTFMYCVHDTIDNCTNVPNSPYWYSNECDYGNYYFYEKVGSKYIELGEFRSDSIKDFLTCNNYAVPAQFVNAA